MAIDSASRSKIDVAARSIRRLIHSRSLSLDLNGDQDPRQGSAREGSSGGTLVAASGNKDSSIQKLGTTFIPVAIFVGVCLVIFIILRRRCRRVYAPRTIRELRAPDLPSPGLPKGWLNWIIPFFKTPDTWVLNHGSLDGFFFLRFLKVMRNICFGGCIITFPILFPIHVTGGNNGQNLDSLTIGNVTDPQKLLAHVFVAWVFFGFVLYMVVRECIYYVNLRQAYLSSSYYAERISSRTIMLTCVPKEYQDERRIRKLYGDDVKRVSIPRTTKALAKLVKEREQTAHRLEKAEIALIKSANLAKKKKLAKCQAAQSPSHTASITGSDASRRTPGDTSSCSSARTPNIVPPLELNLPGSTISMEALVSDGRAGCGRNASRATNHDRIDGVEGEDDEDYHHPYGLSHDLPDVRGSVAAQWIPVEQRPYHRPIGNFFRRVDTIRWTRSRLRDLNKQIHKMRKEARRGDGITLPVVFIEFHTQEAAQAAHQILSHHRPLQMSSRTLGVSPDEVIWSSLRMSWWELIIKRFFILALVTGAVIFWAIPATFISSISSIGSLTAKVKFLGFLNKLPAVILNFVEGFLPPVALSLLMAVVPWLLRICGSISGIPTTTKVELFVQNVYFAFQVVQVFLITTLTTAASGALTKILEKPFEAKDILAENIPKASNFYLSYILIQCLMNGGLRLIQPFGLIRHYLIGRLHEAPRTRYMQWRRLSSAHWGGVYPIFTNMGVIALTYAFIAPLVLVFAAGGMFVTQIVWKYNLMYVIDSDMDTKGLFYPRALMHLVIGLYLAEICLIGIFALKAAYTSVALMVLFFVFTGLVHFSLGDAIAPLLLNLPQTLLMEKEVQDEEKAKAIRLMELALPRPDSEDGPDGAANDYYDAQQAFGDEEEFAQSDDDDGTEDDGSEDEHEVTGTRAVEGAASIGATLKEIIKDKSRTTIRKHIDESGIKEWLGRSKFWKHDKHTSDRPPGFLARWLHPEEYEDFVTLRNSIPRDQLPDIEYPPNFNKRCYLAPEMCAPKPALWIPRDEARVSRQEVAHTRKFTLISDRGAELDEKGRIVAYFDKAPFQQPRIIM